MIHASFRSSTRKIIDRGSIAWAKGNRIVKKSIPNTPYLGLFLPPFPRCPSIVPLFRFTDRKYSTMRGFARHGWRTSLTWYEKVISTRWCIRERRWCAFRRDLHVGFTVGVGDIHIRVRLPSDSLPHHITREITPFILRH